VRIEEARMPTTFRSRLGRWAAVLALFVSPFCLAAPAVGEVPPAVVGTDADGQDVVLKNYAGKAVVLSFWGSWCPQCLKELPVLEGIQGSAGKAQLQVIAVNTEKRDVYRKLARHLSSLTLLQAHDAGPAQAAYGVKGLPHLLIIGRDGRVLKIYRGYDEKSLDKILADINLALATPP
jgi:thiol-disulfide isomerase/thioredoxin